MFYVFTTLETPYISFSCSCPWELDSHSHLVGASHRNASIPPCLRCPPGDTFCLPRSRISGKKDSRSQECAAHEQTDGGSKQPSGLLSTTLRTGPKDTGLLLWPRQGKRDTTTQARYSPKTFHRLDSHTNLMIWVQQCPLQR